MTGYVLGGQKGGMSFISQSLNHSAYGPIGKPGGIQSVSVNKAALDDVPGLPKGFELGRLLGGAHYARFKQQPRAAQRHANTKRS